MPSSFPNLRVDEKAKPEGLEDPEDESFCSIKESELEKVAVAKEGKRSDEERQLVVFCAQSAFALCGIPFSVCDQAAGPA